MSLTRDLIGLIRDKAITRDDLEQAALFTLDTVACAYAGSATPVGDILRRWAAGSDLDDNRAAMLMAALTHITETDDLHRASVTHPGCIVVPAVLSLGARLGAGPARQLRAILHGYEAICRVGASVGPAHYRVWHNTATCGPFGSAMAAASLLELDEAQTLHALGNAGTQAGGFWQFMSTGAMSKHLHAGRACEAGLLAAELARHGFTGSPEILEGKQGFFIAMCDDPEPDRLLADADAPWQLTQTSIKPWPSCRHTHPVIDCALELHEMLADRQPVAVRVTTYAAALDVCDRPLPESEYEAKFSLQHCAALALVDGKVGLDSFDAAARERAGALRKQVALVVDDPYRGRYPASWGAEVSVDTACGETFKVARRDCKGDPELPLDSAAMQGKALGLLACGGLDVVAAEAVCEKVLRLADAATMPALFADFIDHVVPGNP